MTTTDTTTDIGQHIPNVLAERLAYMEHPELWNEMWDPSVWDYSLSDINFKDYFHKLAMGRIREIKQRAYDYIRRHPFIFRDGVGRSTSVMDALRRLQWVFNAGYEDLLIHFGRQDLIPAPPNISRDLDRLVSRITEAQLSFEEWTAESARIHAKYTAWTQTDKYESYRRDYPTGAFRDANRIIREWALRQALLASASTD